MLMSSVQIKYAAKNSIAFMGTGGGHGYTTTTSAVKNGINIDLGAFDSVSINKAASTMTIGGAVTFGDVLGPVFAAGKEIRTLPSQAHPEQTLTCIFARNWILFMCRICRRDPWRRNRSIPGSPRPDCRCASIGHHCNWERRHRQRLFI